MKFTPMQIPEVIRIEPHVIKDNRGFFLESYHKSRFAENGIAEEFVQDNHSQSKYGVLRGLHYQKKPHAQGKLVRALRGAIFDVAVDIRRHSPTFGRWVGETLSAENRVMLYIPAGFAHGFCALENDTEVHYKTTAIYSPQHDAGLFWDDPEIGVRWPDIDGVYLLSEKDLQNPPLSEIEE